MKKWYKNIAFIFGLTVMLTACSDDIDPEITELDVDRAFSPVNLRAFIRNQVEIELDWNVNEGVDEYLVEFSQDSLQFNNIIRTLTVSPDQVPVRETFDGETLYSVRVKAVIDGLQESKWSAITTRTAPEQIFLPIVGPNIEDTYATVEWAPESEVTHLLIVPGNTLIPISEQQKAAGSATIEGLDGGTDYTVTIFNDAIRRGTTTFSTLKEANVSPLDDLSAVIDAAAEGDTLVLMAGVYSLGGKEITRSITIEGQKFYDMPVIEGQLTCATTVASITLRFLDFQGGGSTGQFFNAAAAACNLGALTIEGCEISGYTNNIIYNNSGGTYGDIHITNTYIHDIPGGGGDGFDFRGGAVGSLTVENTTIANGIRTLLRMQVPADVVFSNCTFYRVCTAAGGNNRGFFRMSGGGNSLVVSNCLFVETGLQEGDTPRGVWSLPGDISEEVTTSYSTNYYFNTIGLWDGAITSPGDAGASEADPGFVDAENGDFTVTNQTLIDNVVGDVRWLQ